MIGFFFSLIFGSFFIPLVDYYLPLLLSCPVREELVKCTHSFTPSCTQCSQYKHIVAKKCLSPKKCVKFQIVRIFSLCLFFRTFFTSLGWIKCVEISCPSAVTYYVLLHELTSWTSNRVIDLTFYRSCGWRLIVDNIFSLGTCHWIGLERVYS